MPERAQLRGVQSSLRRHLVEWVPGQQRRVQLEQEGRRAQLEPVREPGRRAQLEPGCLPPVLQSELVERVQDQYLLQEPVLWDPWQA